MGKRQTSGMAGVYYVAAELSTLGYTALVTTRNAKAADIIAINGKTGMTAAIEVKTCGISTSDSFWLLGARDCQKRPDNFAYVFVKLLKNGAHDFYIVPAQFVTKNIEKQKAKTGSTWYYITRERITPFKQKWDLIRQITTKGFSP
jgi:hypothetical protein